MNYTSSLIPHNISHPLCKDGEYTTYINADTNSYDNETFSFFNDDFPVVFPVQPKPPHSDGVTTEKQTTMNDNYAFHLQNNDILSTISDTVDELFIMNDSSSSSSLPLSNKQQQHTHTHSHVHCNNHFLIIKDYSNKKNFQYNSSNNNTKRNNVGLFNTLNEKRLKRLHNSVYNNKTNNNNNSSSSTNSSNNNSNNSSMFKDKCYKQQQQHSSLKYLKKKLKIKRKFKPDDIRKKIKARFHKTLKSILNSFLIKAGSKKVFDFLPQCFVSNISKKMNYNALMLTLREIFEFDFCTISIESRSKNITVDRRKHQNNLEVLSYLDNHPDIAEKSGFNVFAKKSYCDILKEYFVSEEFLHSIKKLKYEKESEEYIMEYKKKAFNYVSFFSNVDNINNNN